VPRVLKPGGEAIFQVYNRVSWLNALSKLMKVGLEHDDAPVLAQVQHRRVQDVWCRVREVKIVPERFPVKSRIAPGLEGDGVQYAVSSGRSTRSRVRWCGASAGTCWRSAESDRALPECSADLKVRRVWQA
jgi:hypothetical protein